MSQPPPTDPQTDADRIRLKRLAKLQAVASAGQAPAVAVAVAVAPSGPSTPARVPTPKAKSAPTPTPTPTPTPAPAPVPSPVPPPKKPAVAAAPFDTDAWIEQSIAHVFAVTLDQAAAEKSGHELVWLKPLADELLSEGHSQPLKLDAELADRVLIARLEIDPKGMSDDLDFLPVLASLPANQSVFEYLVGAWRRLNTAQATLARRKPPPADAARATAALDNVRDLLISYAGLALQDAELFPQPPGRSPAALGAPELLAPLLSLSALSAPLLSASPSAVLAPAEVVPFLQDLARRFEPTGELPDVLGPVLELLLHHPCLLTREGLVGADAGWRRVLSALDALVSVRGVPAVLTFLPAWCPPTATAATFEHASLLGPLLRLGLVARDWPHVAESSFADAERRTRADVDGAFAALRGTLKSLQGALFGVFNALVRAGPGPREQVLVYFARAVRLNVRRAGMQVEPESVASDSFVANLQSVLLRFAEPFMDSQYTKMDRVDPLYFVRSERIDLKEETRICATAPEAAEWAATQEKSAAPPNFVSEVFFLAVALGHYGIGQTMSRYEESLKHYDDIRQHLEMLEGDGSWRGSPMQARTEAAITMVKRQQAQAASAQLAFRALLEDPEFVFRTLGFANFVATWLVRAVDGAHAHPSPTVSLPLPKEVPMAFRVLPEFMFEDVVEWMLFFARYSPATLELAGKNEVVVFALTFLTSTWYVKNPFLKSKLIDILWAGVHQGRDRDRGPLAAVLHEHPLAQKHLMPALMQFYIEVEQTGASSQFYDKFSTRRAMAHIFKFIWNNVVHRDALNREAQHPLFVRFANLMINDVTYLMDESLDDLQKIHQIQTEMADEAAWRAQTREHRQEREKALKQLERMATGYCDLARANVELLRIFTAETKAPFGLPEIVDKLAAMLDYNLDALAGPRVQNLRVAKPEKYRFDLRKLLQEFLQVFLNLGAEEAFVRAVAADGRSYRRELFERAMGIAHRNGIKTAQEIEQLGLFVERVEAMKLTIEAEEDLGELPDEFTDPLMATLMRNPVTLPSSRAVVDLATIKSYLLSETRDPFNRQPLTIEQVIPNPELKAKIDAFIAERQQKKMDVDT